MSALINQLLECDKQILVDELLKQHHTIKELMTALKPFADYASGEPITPGRVCTIYPYPHNKNTVSPRAFLEAYSVYHTVRSTK